MTVKIMDVMLTWVYIRPSWPSELFIPVIRLLFSCSSTSCTRFTVKPSSYCLQEQFEYFLLFKFLMPSTRRQKAKARKSRELDLLSDYSKMDVMLGEGNSNSIEREWDSFINVPERQQDFQSFPNREIISRK